MRNVPAVGKPVATVLTVQPQGYVVLVSPIRSPFTVNGVGLGMFPAVTTKPCFGDWGIATFTVFISFGHIYLLKYMYVLPQ